MNTLVDTQEYEVMYEEWKFKRLRRIIKNLFLISLLLVALILYYYTQSKDMGITVSMLSLPVMMLITDFFLHIHVWNNIKRKTYKIDGVDPYVNFKTSGMKVPYYEKFVVESGRGDRIIFVDYILNFENNKISLIDCEDGYEIMTSHNLDSTTFQFQKKNGNFDKTLLIKNDEDVYEIMLIEALVPKLFDYVKAQGYNYLELD